MSREVAEVVSHVLHSAQDGASYPGAFNSWTELQYYAATEKTGKHPYQLIDTLSVGGARLSVS